MTRIFPHDQECQEKTEQSLQQKTRSQESWWNEGQETVSEDESESGISKVEVRNTTKVRTVKRYTG